MILSNDVIRLRIGFFDMLRVLGCGGHEDDEGDECDECDRGDGGDGGDEGDGGDGGDDDYLFIVYVYCCFS